MLDVIRTYGSRMFVLQVLCTAIFVICIDFSAFAQPCDSITPSFVVDLSSNPDTVWISPDTVRIGNCCGTTKPDRCIEFILTLHEDAEAIIFDIYSGAVPPGALYYQVDCGPQIEVGNVICLIGTGPHNITFCKPGNNPNEYSITSIPTPSASNDIAVNQGCTGTLYALGYDNQSIVWTSIFPGAPGDYDSMLNCTSGCDTVIATGGPSPPPYVDFQVCGTPVSGCDSFLIICDTSRVYFNTELFASILPVVPTVCFGGTNTTITANGIGGTPPYSYLWSTGDTTQSITVGVGTYSVLVADTSYPNCPAAMDTIEVTAFLSPISVNAGPDQALCINSDSIQLSGTVTAASGGIWSGGNGTFIPAVDSLNVVYIPDSAEIAFGSVALILTTTGNGSCPADADTVLITIFNIDSISVTGTNLTCYNVCDGSATVTIYGGSSPYTYQWNDPAIQTSQTATGLCAGIFDVTIADLNGCSSTTSIIITEPDSFIYYLTVSDSLDCDEGACGGQLELDNVTGGTAPYIFTWSPPGFNVLDYDDGTEYEDICVGDVYYVTITDTNGCSLTDSILLIAPDTVFPAILSVTNVSCNGLCDGAATVAATGGIGPYEFDWSPSGGETVTATNLCFGTYTVFIEDVNGCDTTILVIITEPPVLIATISSLTNVSCYGAASGSATVVASGGTPPYTFQWDDPLGQTNATATGLTALDYYNVDVIDSNGCIAQAEVVISEPAILLTVISDSTNVSCNGGNDGSATLIASGGTPFYTYLWNSSPVQTTATASGLEAGSYTVLVTDANGCDTTVDVTISEPGLLIATINFPINPLCNGGTDGEATATAISGTSPYTYSWNTLPVQTNAVVTGIPDGIYTVIITDNSGCTATASVVLVEPTPIILSVTTEPANCGNCDGEATVVASGGTPFISGSPYIYSWITTPVQNSQTAVNLCPGSYSITVLDSNDCAAIETILISDLDVNIALDSVVNVTCNGGSDGLASTLASGGTLPYTYQWDINAGDKLLVPLLDYRPALIL